MKLRHLLFGLLAGVAFVACTNDDDPAGASPVNGGNEVAATKYMAINFVMPGDATTRAWNNDFEAATGDEIAVADVQILFFDGEGQVADPYIGSDFNTGWTAVEGTTESVDKKHDAVIVLKNAIKDPTSIVAILNTTGLNVTRQTTMTQLKEMTADFRKAIPEGQTAAANLAMINSVYVNGEEVQFAVPATGKTKDSEEAALGDPVKIAVEKVVAKVTLTNGVSGDDTTVDTTPVGEGQTAKNITFDVDGWWLDSTNPESYLVKSLNTSYTEFGDWSKWKWNDTDYKRSYWANSLAMTAPEHFTLTAGKKALTDPIYANENTDQTQPTELVVAATLKVDGNAETLVKFMTDVYTLDDFEKLLYGSISTTYYTRTGDENTGYTYTSVADTQFDYNYATNSPAGKVQFGDKNEDIADYEAVVTMTYTGTEPLYYYNGTEAVTFAPLKKKVQYWAGGKTYYHIPIIHNSDITVGTGTTAHPLYGVVRNHLYKININSITGLGTAIANTNQVIVPVTPPDDKKTLLAADIVILKYKVVEQNVDLK